MISRFSPTAISPGIALAAALLLAGTLFAQSSVMMEPFEIDVLGDPPNYVRRDFAAGAGLIRGIAVADFDGDGEADVLTSQSEARNARLQTNDGAGTSLRANAVVPTENDPGVIVTGDFNQDQQLDFAVANFRSHSISVFLRDGAEADGTLTFSSRNVFVGFGGPSDLEAVDVNGDGATDLVIPLVFRDQIVVLTGDGRGRFNEASRIAASENPQNVDSGDFNKDGIPDIAVAHLHNDEVLIFLGDGAGGFEPVEPIAPTDDFASRRFEEDQRVADVAVGDFNKDGFDDVASIHTDRSDVRIELGDGTGALVDSTTVASDRFPRAVVAADLNRDGQRDLVILSQILDQVTVIIAKGSLSFRAARGYQVSDQPRALALGNFDDKSGRDILVAAVGGISVLSPVEKSMVAGDLGKAGGLAVPLKAPAPTITAISPTQGSTAGGYTMLLQGTGFAGATGVTVGGTPASNFVVHPVSTGRLKLVVPPGVAGPASIIVQSPMGSSTPATFTYTASPSPEESLRFTRLIYCNALVGAQLPSLATCLLNSSKDTDVADFTTDFRPDIYAGKTSSAGSVDTDEVWFNTGSNGPPVIGSFLDDLGVTRNVTRETGRFQVFPNVVTNDYCGPSPPPMTTCSNKVQYDIQAADLDGDFDIDVVGMSSSQLRIQLLSGLFTDVTATNVTGAPAGFHGWDDVDIGDIDQDGDLDIVGAARGSGVNEILFNDGTGNFTADTVLFANAAAAVSQPTTHTSHDVELVDLENDGDLDVVFSGTSNGPRIYENTMTMQVPGSIGFNLIYHAGDMTRLNPPPSAPTIDHVSGNRPFGATDAIDLFVPRFLKPLDYNGDGLVDLWFGTRSGADHVYINQGGPPAAGSGIGYFTELANVPFPNGLAYGGSSGDFDLDGRIDILQGDYFGEPMIYLNRIQQGQPISQINMSPNPPFAPIPEPLTDSAGAVVSRRESLAEGTYWPSVTNQTTGGLLESDESISAANADSSFVAGRRTGFLGSFTQILDGDVGDFDLDGDLDIVFGTGDHQERSNRIYLNDTDPAPLPPSDVWARDNTGDTGAVPSSGMLWKSPDLWLRRNPDCLPSPGGMPCTDANHQNPIFGQASYIYGKLRNNLAGAQTIARAELQLYIGKASTGLVWPDSFAFVGNLTVTNLLPGQVINFGPLQWTPPNPAPSNHFCFYVRIQSVQDSISFVETASVPFNVANSNNIIWRNINVLVGGTGKAENEDQVDFIVRNVNDFDDLVDLEFDTPAAYLGNSGQVVITVDPDLLEGWDGTFEGLVAIDDLTYLVEGNPAALRNLALTARQEGPVSVFFQIPSQFNQDLDFNVTQVQDGETVGGSTFRAPKASYPDCQLVEQFESEPVAWTASAESTCTRGGFVLGTPEEIVDGGVRVQPDGDHTSGTGNALFTADTADDESLGTRGVEGGTCILTSPVYDVGEASELMLFYFHGQRDAGNDPEGDFFRLEVSTDGGKSFSSIVSKGDETSTADWTQATAEIPAGSEVQIRVLAGNGPLATDLIKAGIDDIMICKRNVAAQ